MKQITFSLIFSICFIKSNCYTFRIVSGTRARIENYPYMALLLENENTMFCGGAIISPEYVLTAAHCLNEVSSVNALGVHVGTAEAGGDDGTYYPAAKMIHNKNFNEKDLWDDIGLIKIRGRFAFSNKVQPIPVATMNFPVNVNDMISIAGWGHTQEDGESSDYLIAAQLPIVDHSKCLKKYNQPELVNTLCAGFPRGGADTCQGDSGGPMVLSGTLIGVVSFGNGCGSEFPGIYTDVRKYTNWINSNADSRLV